MSERLNNGRGAMRPGVYNHPCLWAAALMLIEIVGCSTASPGSRATDGSANSAPPLAGMPGPLGNITTPSESPATAAPAVLLPQDMGTVNATATEGGCGAAVTAPPPNNAIDIIWVVDASVSMLDEQQRIAENLTRFADTITAAALDVRIIMLTTAATIPVVCMPPSTDPAANTALNGDPRYSFIETLVDSNNPLDIVLAQFSQYQTLLRPGATTHLIFVSDDESRYGGALDPTQRSSAFEQEMRNLLGHPFYAHTISSPGPTPCVPAECVPPQSTGFVCDIVAAICTTSAPGLSYWQLAEDTGGLAASICETDWSQIFDPLTEAIVSTAPLPCTYTIPPPPLGMDLNPDKVNVSFAGSGAASEVWPRAGAADACADNLAWYFANDTANDSGTPDEVRLCPAACAAAEQGGTLDLSFGCEAQILE